MSNFKNKAEAFAALQNALKTLQALKTTGKIALTEQEAKLLTFSEKAVTQNSKAAKEQTIKQEIRIEYMPTQVYIADNGKIVRRWPVEVGDEEPKYMDFTIRSDQFTNGTSLTRTVFITIEGHAPHKKEERLVIDHSVQIPAGVDVRLEVALYWYGDGEKEFPIFINGYCGEEDGGKKSYWDEQLLREVGEETGSNFIDADISDAAFPNADALFVDGDPNFDDEIQAKVREWMGEYYDSGIDSRENMNPDIRYKRGEAQAYKDFQYLMLHLKRDGGKSLAEDPAAKTKLITQPIQIITHSRGGVFEEGYTKVMRVLIKQSRIFAYPDKAIEIEIGLDVHQDAVNFIEPKSNPEYHISHVWSILGDAFAKGDVLNIVTDSNNPPLVGHKNGTFASEVDAIYDQFNVNNQEGKNKYEGVGERMEAQGINVKSVKTGDQVAKESELTQQALDDVLGPLNPLK